VNRRAYALGVVMVSLTAAAAVGLRAVAEAAFLASYGAELLPYLFVAHAVALAASTLGYDWLTARRGATGFAAVDTGLLVVLGLVAALAPSLLRAGGAAPFVVVLAVVALSSVASLALWNSLAAAVAGRDARRGLPRAGAAVTAGGAAAGLLAAALVKRIGPAPIAYGAAVLVVVVIVVAAKQRAALASGGAPGATAPPGSAPTMSGDHRALVRWLFAAAILEAAVATILEVRFSAGMKARWSGADLAVAVALFLGLTNLVLLALQLTAVPRLLVTRRLPTTVSIHPLGLVAAALGVLAAPGFVAIAIARTADQVLRPATSRTGQEVSLSALPPVPRARWKVLLRGAATPIGVAAMGGVLILLARAGASGLATLAAIVLGLILVWLVAVRAAAGRFLAALATPLGLRGLATSGVDKAGLDLAQLEAAVAAAGSDDPRTAAIGRALVARTSTTADELARRLEHEDAAVRAAVFELVARAPSPAVRREVAAAVAIEDDDDALCRGLRALAALGEAGGLERGRDRSVNSDAVARAVEAAEVQLGQVTGDAAALRVRALARRDGAWAAAIARAHPALAGAITDELSAGDPDTRSAIATAQLWRAAAGAGHAGLAARLLAALAAGAPGTLAAISELDEHELEALAQAIEGADVPEVSRVALARARAAGAVAGTLLWRLATDADPEVRGAALRSLVTRVRIGATVAAGRIGPIVDRELDELEGLLAAREAGTPSASAVLRAGVRRVLDAAAIEAAAAGRDPAPLVALGRYLVVAAEPARKRALDVVQEVSATRPRLLDAIERYLRPVAAGMTSHAGEDTAAAALRRTAIFADAPPRTLAVLAAAARPHALAAGATLFAAGDAADAMYVVVSGELAVAGVETPVTVGHSVGELAVADDGPRTATVTARTAATLYAIDRATFRAAVDRSPEIGVALAARFASWLV
jgi:hypothetical protein